MTFNPVTHRWEGNENSLGVFDFPPPLATPTPLPHSQQNQTSYMSHHHQGPPSPPRPALIAPMSAASTQNIQVVGGMVFDPVRMCWLKFKPEKGAQASGPKSPSVTENDDEEDPFADIEDLKETTASGPVAAGSTNGAQKKGLGGLTGDEWLVGEEFDLGPEFIRRQKEEEIAWRKRCESWFANAEIDGAPRSDTAEWRWRIREIAGMPT